MRTLESHEIFPPFVLLISDPSQSLILLQKQFFPGSHLFPYYPPYKICHIRLKSRTFLATFVQDNWRHLTCFICCLREERKNASQKKCNKQKSFGPFLLFNWREAKKRVEKGSWKGLLIAGKNCLKLFSLWRTKNNFHIIRECHGYLDNFSSEVHLSWKIPCSGTGNFFH